jgi:O-antigen biosynthesis protein
VVDTLIEGPARASEAASRENAWGESLAGPMTHSLSAGRACRPTKPMKIAFLIHRSSISGGTYVVFQHALHASQAGHDVTIITLVKGSPHIDAWHPAVPHLKFVQIEDAKHLEFDIVYATLWSTVLDLHRVRSRRYAYFVQSIESRFYPPQLQDKRNFIDAMYAWNLPGVTEATWIRDHLAKHYGSRYHLVRNGIRKDLYTCDGPRHAEPGGRRPRVLVEGSFGAIKNTARALGLARQASGIETWLLTMSDMPWYPGVKRLFTNVPVDQVPAIYRSCDLILKLSLVEGMFGPPLEMFHCGGTAVVYDVSGHDEYIENGKNALVVKMHDEDGVLKALRRITEEPGLLESLKRGALATAADWPSWDVSSAEFLAATEDLCDAEAYTRERLIDELGRLEQQFPGEFKAHRRPESELARASLFQSLRKSVRRYRTIYDHIAESYR